MGEQDVVAVELAGMSGAFRVWLMVSRVVDR
jgi:hypothetical protein